MSIIDELSKYAKSTDGKGSMAKNVVGGLGALYFGNQAYDNLGSSVGAIDGNIDAIRSAMSGIPSADALYGLNSPYAQQMAQTLARKDAAAGRNSQYGPRAAQYAAAMADKYGAASRDQATLMASYNKQLSDLANLKAQQSAGQSQIRAQQLAQLFNVADNIGLTKKFDQGLSDLFGFGNVNEGNADKAYIHSNAGYGDYYDTGADSQVQAPQQTQQEAIYGNDGYGDYWNQPTANTPGTSSWGNEDPYQWY